MIVSARPMTNPFSTGSEMKLARKPRRSAPATSGENADDERQRDRQLHEHVELPAATSPTAAAERAAVAAVGPVTRWRELPNAA